jgi:glycerol-3-phosphate dehydrogenase
MNREAMRAALDTARDPWDVLVIGGGATGLGCALDAASRGFRTVLVEKLDFAAGTSSRSTKLFHGGVRYLRGGHVQMVAQSLRERGTARRQAPGLVHDAAFLVPAYGARERLYYQTGLRLYDWLAHGHSDAPRSHAVSRDEALRLAPTLRAEQLSGGVVYHDYQFDDARFAIELARAAASRGAVLLNYASVTGLLRSGDRITGAAVHDHERGDDVEVRARVVVNAAGVYADSVRRLRQATLPAMLRLSRGAHIVLERAFLPGDTAVLVPRTDDDRVVFLIPWRGRTLVGTTDTPVEAPSHEPLATSADIDYLLEHASRYLSRAPARADVRSAFAGLRPLPTAKGPTANLRRDHRVEAAGGMVTICGGKWTTYRLMASDAIDAAAREGGLGAGIARPPAVLAGPPEGNARLEAEVLAGAPLTPDGVREIERLAREEMARTVEDVLARRTRVLFLDARRAADAARQVAETLARVLGRDAVWAEAQVKAFTALAGRYLPS